MIYERKIRVSEVMVSDLHTVDGLATVTDAVALMSRHRISSLVVDRRDPDDEWGLIDVAGIAREVIARNHVPDRVNVYEVMTKPVLTLRDLAVRHSSRGLQISSSISPVRGMLSTRVGPERAGRRGHIQGRAIRLAVSIWLTAHGSSAASEAGGD